MNRIIIAALLLIPGIANAATVYGEKTWGGFADDYAVKLLRVSKGRHTVSAVADKDIYCAVKAPTGGILSASKAVQGQACVVSWSTEETATFTYIVVYNDERVMPFSWEGLDKTFTYKAGFQ